MSQPKYERQSRSTSRPSGRGPRGAPTAPSHSTDSPPYASANVSKTTTNASTCSPHARAPVMVAAHKGTVPHSLAHASSGGVRFAYRAGASNRQGTTRRAAQGGWVRAHGGWVRTHDDAILANGENNEVRVRLHQPSRAEAVCPPGDAVFVVPWPLVRPVGPLLAQLHAQKDPRMPYEPQGGVTGNNARAAGVERKGAAHHPPAARTARSRAAATCARGSSRREIPSPHMNGAGLGEQHRNTRRG